MDKKEESVDPLITELADLERKRNQKTLLITGVLLTLAVLMIGFTLAYRQDLLGPRVDVEAGEAEVFSETNDPICRGLIESVTKRGEDWKTLQKDLRSGLVTGNQGSIESLIARVQEMRAQLKEDHAQSRQANMRFAESREELDTWFGYVDKELEVFAKIGMERLAELGGEAVEGQLERTPSERVDAVVLATDDAFQNFRVWHSSALHPCGPAVPEGTP